MRADHVMLGADDMDRMTAWYRNALGFEVENAWTVEGLPGIRLAYLTGHGFRLELIAGGAPRTPVPASFPEHFTMRGFQHLCFWVDDMDAAVAELERQGVPMFVPATDYPEGAERRVAFVKDLDGSVVELAGPLAGR
jgi:catechol 2,3-dioxygenase-like lactoylglutathione lyase family enzyme